MYLIIGSTGNVGNEVVTQLRDLKHNVRAFVRDPSKAPKFPEGTEIAVGNLDDFDSLKKAANGVDAVFFMQISPSVKQAEQFVKAIKEEGVKKVVILSSIGTHLEPKPLIGTAIAARDEVFQNSGLEVTFLCPNTLMSNALAWASEILEKGSVTDPTDPGKTGPTDPYDIARVAAIALTENGHAGKNYILNGPEALSTREQTTILSKVLNRPIAFKSITPEEFAEQMIKNGTPEQEARAVQDLYTMFTVGRAGVLTSEIENITGKRPRSFLEWCKIHQANFS